MQFRTIFAAAGLVVAAMGISTGAQAQPYHGDGYQRASWHDNGGHRGWNDRRDWRGGRHYRPVRHCWTEWRHHHRVRVCR